MLSNKSLQHISKVVATHVYCDPKPSKKLINHAFVLLLDLVHYICMFVCFLKRVFLCLFLFKKKRREKCFGLKNKIIVTKKNKK